VYAHAIHLIAVSLIVTQEVSVSMLAKGEAIIFPATVDAATQVGTHAHHMHQPSSNIHECLLTGLVPHTSPAVDATLS